MAHDPGPCAGAYEDYDDAYADYSDAFDAANKGIKNVGVSTGIAVAGCILLPFVGCALGAANALNNDYDSIQASLALGDAIDAMNDAWKAYKDCVHNHKEYYKQD